MPLLEDGRQSWSFLGAAQEWYMKVRTSAHYYIESAIEKQLIYSKSFKRHSTLLAHHRMEPLALTLRVLLPLFVLSACALARMPIEGGPSPPIAPGSMHGMIQFKVADNLELWVPPVKSQVRRLEAPVVLSALRSLPVTSRK